MRAQLRVLAAVTVLFSVSCASLPARRQSSPVKPTRSERRDDQRAAVLARAQVWRSTDVGKADLMAGPRGAGSCARNATITCDYLDKKLSGLSPKFACRLANGDELKVKYGGNNGEVYGELLATRLLWALGFGADTMYPVNVICRGCPREFAGIPVVQSRNYFDSSVTIFPGGGKQSLKGPVGVWVILDLALEGNYIAIRPSGTEPKVKFYLFTFVPAEQLHLLDEAREQMGQRLSSMESELRAIAQQIPE
jgi:hypothetical protein